MTLKEKNEDRILGKTQINFLAFNLLKDLQLVRQIMKIF